MVLSPAFPTRLLSAFPPSTPVLRLPLAEARCGAMLECGRCGEITSWRFTLDPFILEQVPNEWGGSIECD